jgi:hypothetical protein
MDKMTDSERAVDEAIRNPNELARYGKIVEIAQVCHAANAAYCATMGDFSQPAWADAPEWQRASAINGVRFHLDHPHAGDAASHENWMAEKIALGWRFGPVKDPDVKTHPCLLPFGALPETQQKKDRLFRMIVHALKP